jgi:hypothetical protein
MARRTSPKPPDLSVLSEQPLVTPPLLPEMPSGAMSTQLSEINRHLGILEGRFNAQDARLGKFAADIEGVQKEASKALGFIGGAKWAAGIFITVLGAFGILFWAMLGSKISTIFTMAEDKQVLDRQAQAAATKLREPDIKK